MNIDKENLLKALRNGAAEGLRSHELADGMNADVKGRHRLRTLLDTLVDDKVLEKAPGNRYRIVGAPPVAVAPPPSPARRCRRAGSPARCACIRPATASSRPRTARPCSCRAKYRGTSLDGDRVAVDTWPGVRGTEGRVDEVLARGRARLTGILRRVGRAVYLEPDDPRIAADCGRVGSTTRRRRRTATRSSSRSRAIPMPPPTSRRRASSRCSAIPRIRAPRSRRSSRAP